MRDNYDGTEYGRVYVGRGKAVHFGNRTDKMTACGKRGDLQDATGYVVTCKVCVKMSETTHDGSRPLIKDEQPAAPVAPAEPAQQLLFTCFECEGEHVGTFAGYSIYGGAALYEVTCDRDNLTDRYTLEAFWKPMPEASLGLDLTPTAPVEPEPTQTFEVTYLAPRTGTQRVETVEATTVHAVPVEPRDAEVLLSIYLVTKESALLALTAASAEARSKYLVVDLPQKDPVQRAAVHGAWRMASRREDLARLRARQMGATVDETYAATVAGIRQVDPNY